MRLREEGGLNVWQAMPTLRATHSTVSALLASAGAGGVRAEVQHIEDSGELAAQVRMRGSGDQGARARGIAILLVVGGNNHGNQGGFLL